MTNEDKNKVYSNYLGAYTMIMSGTVFKEFKPATIEIAVAIALGTYDAVKDKDNAECGKLALAVPRKSDVIKRVNERLK